MSKPLPERREGEADPADGGNRETMPLDPLTADKGRIGDTIPNSTGIDAASQNNASMTWNDASQDPSEVAETIMQPSGLMETMDVVQARVRQKAAAILKTQVGEYEIERELGRGGMGVVYKARHRQLKRDVALKMILAGRHAGPEQLERFLAEARAVAQLQHPNVVQIFDISEHEGLPYFSLEFVDGQSLAQYLGKQPQHPDEAGRMLELLARAMQYAHDHGVLHRDLKPANVLLTKEGVPKVTDFGLAKKVDDDESASTRTGTVMGTPSYMAPEQAMGLTHELSPATDQYSLGAILYEMLTGRPPFLAAKAVDTVLQVIRNEPVRPRQLEPSVPVDLETICLKALQKEPGKRYVSCMELAEDLRRFRVGEPILARPVGPVERAIRWCKRNPRVAIPSISAVLLLVLFSIVSAWSAITVSNQNIVISKERDNAEKQEKLAIHNAKLAKEAQGAAEVEAQNAKKQEGIAKERAEAAKNQAKLVMTNMQLFIDEIDSKISKVPGVLELRMSILGSIVKAWDDIDSSVRDDEEGSAVPTLMAARMKVAGIYADVGKLELADEEYKKIFDVVKHRIEVKKGSDASRLNFGKVCLVLGRMREQVNRDPQQSLRHYDEAVQMMKDIQEHPKPEPYGPAKFEVQNVLGEALQRVGTSYLSQGKLAEASKYFEEALDVRQKLLTYVATDPAFAAVEPAKRKDLQTEFEVSLDKSVLALGNLAFRREKFAEAEKSFQQSFDRRKALYDSNTTSVANKIEFARFCGSFGDFYFWTDRPDKARPLFDLSIHLLGELVAENPKNVTYQNYWSTAYYRLGCLLDDLNDPAAQDAFESSRKLREEIVKASSDSQKRQSEWMMALARCGNVEQASQLAAKLRAVKLDAEIHLERARALAQSFRYAKQDEQRQSLRNDAFEALEFALRDGYADPFKIEREPDLKPLRDDPRFAEVLAKVPAAE
jgi:serine/threonine protein kinase